MDVTKTKDAAAVREAARIWAASTAKRDEDLDEAKTHELEDAEATQLISESVDASDRSFLLTLNHDEDMMVFAAIQPARETTDETAAELRYLGVAPGHWGEGWARRLLVAVPEALREEGFKTAELWVYADNIRAIFVYEALGWQATKETRKHPETGRIEQRYVLTPSA